MSTSPWALLITPIVPDPEGIGLARRAWRWVAELSARHLVLKVLVVADPPRPMPSGPLLVPVELLRRAGPPLRTRHLTDWVDPDQAMADALSNLSGPPPDRVVVFRLYLHDVAALLPPAWRARAEMDCDDCESVTRWSLAGLALRHGRVRQARALARDALHYGRVEREVLPSYALTHVAAAEDVARLRRHARDGNVRVAPNQIALRPDLHIGPPPLDRRHLLFVGSLTYPPNDDAVRWLGKSIAPRLRAAMPDIRITVAGAASPALAARMARTGIDYLAAPDDLADAYAQASAVIAPLRGGGGTKFKILEAWLHGRPVVATPHACRGLDAEPDRHLLQAGGAAAFAGACMRLLRDQELAARLVRDGGDLLRARFLLPEARPAAADPARCRPDLVSR
ncbi:glycosyltransferase [Rhodoplanes roseus]|uniref:Glycosyltransferase n=1 Tax=Rhodoplanes roseus TaxID=29409 RepID=A0A327KRW3_9BRAD|nr:glycosyltransferase [Rhodoplanes roseus]RAI38088.1 hypothetical protein CH341_28490 [Rhodoplanes roseus]